MTKKNSMADRTLPQRESRSQRFRLWPISGTVAAVLSLALLVAAPPWAAQADIIPALTMTGFGNYDTRTIDPLEDYSLGYTFTTTQTLTITALGTIDIGGNTIATASGPIPVKLYYSALPPDTSSIVDGGQTSGTLVPGASVSVSDTDPILSITGGAYTSGDGFRYVNLSSPIALPAGTYELVSSTLGMTGSFFGYQATGISVASGMGLPSNATYIVNPNSGYNTAGYATSTFNSNLPADFGPNMLLDAPEPSSAALLAFGPMVLIARYRRHRD